MRLELMASDVLETVLGFLTGFDVFELSHASHEWLLRLEDPTFWHECLHGRSSADTQAPPWMKKLKASAHRLRYRMESIVQRDMGQSWKMKYMLERSVFFRGMGPQDFIYRRQRGPYAYLEHNVSTESRQQRPMAYLAGNSSLSFDVWFCLLPDTRTGSTTRQYGRCAGGVIYGLDCDDLGDDRWQPVVLDSKCNLYCSLLGGRTMVAPELQTNRWHHVALTYDREKQVERVYVDGVNVHFATGERRREWTRMAYQQIGTGHVVAGDGDFPYPGYSGAYDFRGLIDEFRVWRGVLSLSDVAELARGGTLPYRDVWASMKLPGRKTMGLGVEWVPCTRPAERGVVLH
ncbi:hypothetical protein PF002_g20843 [Phytophthora fragariae]|uniref:F-box domain-containing protein n=2 Tax=Phytophthora fragariae TaxID=53985 RepID=A0A6A3XJH2_9STRA|nr:hypothetical protein PF009_g20436 [Phytophthora fragariae]KAE9111796.1 hypothetical protein PF006_g20125 [Phytophthora fragariae]KAE9203734.1 hypothetical protein PF002_g20843 [Phytophthora fragariae]